MLSGEVLSLITISGVVGGVLGAMLKGIPFLNKKGVNIDKALATTEQIADVSDKALDVAGEIMPNNPVIKVLDKVAEWAKIAAGNAQQLYHTGDLKSDERFTTAQNIVYSALKELNVDLSDLRKVLIDAAIRDAVNSLGHAPVSEQQLLQQKQELEQQNIQLKQTIEQVQNTVVDSNITTPSTTQTAPQAAQ